MQRKICVITSSRADYGLLRLILKGIDTDSDLILQLVVTGMHLSSKYGDTYQEILTDGFVIDMKIDTLVGDNDAKGVSESVGLGVSKFAVALEELRPDLVLVLGDRFEIFAAVIAAHVALIPVAHIHGGELTEGAIDDAFRHSITKMSQLHFVSTQEYANRVIQLGEQPGSVFVSGGLGVDAISQLKLLSKSELESILNLKFGEKNLLITFHPVTLELAAANKQINELLAALDQLSDINYIFTSPNADPGSSYISQAIARFVATHDNSSFFASLGQLNYFSCIQFVDGVVGNSSSGILEIPTFRKGTINIGDRQQGRVQAGSVINCKPDVESILNAIKVLYSAEFMDRLRASFSPYGAEGASNIILRVIKNLTLPIEIKKSFYDLAMSEE
jgi:GDP/UDP-N,N'-diacetylbacillosamine 2-epimerase (hydrolysing)